MHVICGASPMHLLENCEKTHITTHEGMHLPFQTCPTSHMMPHPPPCIWAHPCDQSQATTLLNQRFTIRHIKSISM